MKSPLRKFVCFVGVLVAVCLSGCGVKKGLKNASLAEYQLELLEESFEVASMIPVKPHMKDRSRAQGKAIQALLELEQPQRILEYADQIGNWRRGKVYADFSYYSVAHGLTNRVDSYLDLAEKIAHTATQEWRRDAVLDRIAQVNVLIGAHEAGKDVPEEHLVSFDEVDFENQFGRIDPMLSSGALADIESALGICVNLYEHNYADEARRTKAEQKLRNSWRKVPVFVRIDFLKKMARVSLYNDDPGNALRIVTDAHDLMTQNAWPVQYRVPLVASLAELRFLSGDPEVAKQELADAITLYNEKNAEILTTTKAESLIPVAEAACAMGDLAESLSVYKMAVEASVENPNSRPQAEDISQVCLSLALKGVEPDAAFFARIREIKEGLGDPW